MESIPGSVREKQTKGIDVKRLVTFPLTAAFSVLALRGDRTGQQFQTDFAAEIGCYVGTQIQKRLTQNKERARAVWRGPGGCRKSAFGTFSRKMRYALRLGCWPRANNSTLTPPKVFSATYTPWPKTDCTLCFRCGGKTL